MLDSVDRGTTATLVTETEGPLSETEGRRAEATGRRASRRAAEEAATVHSGGPRTPSVPLPQRNLPSRRDLDSEWTRSSGVVVRCPALLSLLLVRLPWCVSVAWSTDSSAHDVRINKRNFVLAERFSSKMLNKIV